MDLKTLTVLEFPKILDRLAAFCDFSASAELAHALQPSAKFDEVARRQAETSEARLLLATTDATIGGSHDIRPQVDIATRGGVLEPQELLDIQRTLIAARDLKKLLERHAGACPRLNEIALALPSPQGLVEAISRAIAENGEVLDSASPQLASIRSEVRVAYDRLMNRMQRYITDPKTTPLLQEALITQRDGRYVLPLRAEFKGRVKSIIHDQSASGATLYIEPLVVVELNNRYRELQLAERDEIRRVLADLSGQVAAQADVIVPGISALAELDLVFARAKYAEELRAAEPVLIDGRLSSKDHKPTIRLYDARHPLLDPKSVVPVDLVLESQIRAMIITGPNTGGKTVTLKIIGLLVVMAQAGLHIPVQSGSELSLFEAVYADIGDEQSIEQSLSTFSGHITNIIRILQQANSRSLVILDELGAGTDPQEGSALARAILTHLLERNVTTFVATHYPELKIFAQVMPGVVNASLEFDLKTLRPTYHLTIGLPGRSNALAIAERLGLPNEIINLARAEIDPADLQAEDLLDEIHRQRDLARQARSQAEQARDEAESMRSELENRLERIDDERQAVLQAARREAEAQVTALQQEIKDVKKQLQKARQSLEMLKPAEAQARVIEERIPKAPEPREIGTGPEGPIQPGERVRLRSLRKEGIVMALNEAGAEVQVGSLRVRVKRKDIQRIKQEQQQPVSKQPPAEHSTRPSAIDLQASPGMEIDLRGQASDEALEALDRYLDQAYLAGMPFVRIIHGKGTGKLRQVVRQALKEHPQIASFEEGQDREGGAGVTVAKLKS